jgi:hypothetical protein
MIGNVNLLPVVKASLLRIIRGPHDTTRLIAEQLANLNSRKSRLALKPKLDPERVLTQYFSFSKKLMHSKGSYN